MILSTWDTESPDTGLMKINRGVRLVQLTGGSCDAIRCSLEVAEVQDDFVEKMLIFITSRISLSGCYVYIISLIGILDIIDIIDK